MAIASAAAVTEPAVIAPRVASDASADILHMPIRAARQAAALANVEQISVATSLSELLALERSWHALECAAGRSSNAFQSFDWCAAWARTFDGSSCQPFVITGKRAGRIKFIWPLMRTCMGPFCVLRWLTDPFCQYGDVLVAPDAEPEHSIAAAWRWIQKHGRADVMRLRHVRADATARSFLSRNFCTAGEPECAPYLDLSPYPDERAYDGRYSKIQRRRRKRIKSELEGMGELRFEMLEHGPSFAGAVDLAIAEKRAWLAERDLYSQPLASDRMSDFLKALAGSRGGKLRVVASVLSAGGAPVSLEIGLRFKDRHYAYITAHERTLTPLSPARLHMDLSQRQAIRDGIETFDLMVPGDPHKESWSSGTVAVADFYAPLNWRGRLYGKTYLEWLRPALKRGYRAAPPALRRHALRFAGNVS